MASRFPPQCTASARRRLRREREREECENLCLQTGLKGREREGGRDSHNEPQADQPTTPIRGLLSELGHPFLTNFCGRLIMYGDTEQTGSGYTLKNTILDCPMIEISIHDVCYGHPTVDLGIQRREIQISLDSASRMPPTPHVCRRRRCENENSPLSSLSSLRGPFLPPLPSFLLNLHREYITFC